MSITTDGKISHTSQSTEFHERVKTNQQKLTTELKSHYDFIVCGSGSAGSAVAGRLAENPNVNVLLVEAGGSDDVPSVMDAHMWHHNLGSELDWGFKSLPNASLNGRSVTLNMGKVLGGGSSINLMAWARGHKNDWDFFANEAGDAAWNYESVLKVYHRIEEWGGAPDPKYRGTSGPVFVQPAPDPSPIVPATLEAARSVGIPVFENQNGRMMEGDGGASVLDLLLRDGKRKSIFRAYVYPLMDRPNLTVLTDALVTRLTLERARVTGVEIAHAGQILSIAANLEVVLSLGAFHTPKVLMQSGIGNEAQLERFGIPTVQHLPGVGQNLQDHPGFGCMWEYRQPLAPRNNGSEATLFWKSDPALDAPDLQICQAEIPFCSPDSRAQFDPPAHAWTFYGNVAQPKSRGRIRLTGPNPEDPIEIESNVLLHPDDMKVAVACVELCREIAHSVPLRNYVRREVMPGSLKGAGLESFIRNEVGTYRHQTSTAKMGLDAMSAVDGNLKVYGIDRLRIADASIMPRVTIGNTMAPCVVIGERAAEILKTEHNL